METKPRLADLVSDEMLREKPAPGDLHDTDTGSQDPLDFTAKSRVRAAVIFALTTVIPFLVLLYIIHLLFFSGERVSVAWVSSLSLIAFAIALLGGKLMKEAWGKLAKAVETIGDLKQESEQLREAVESDGPGDEIDRIPFVVNHLAEIARKQRDELRVYQEQVEVLSTRVEEADRELKELSREDELTALYNLRYFGDRVGEEVARTRRYQRDLALAMIEVDSFKGYTGVFGREAADKALSTIGEIIRESIRETDLAFRYADDEFAIILPETTADRAVNALERVRAAVEKHSFQGADAQLNGALTLSVGISMLGKDANSLEEFVSAADKALKKAKSLGQNRVVVFSRQ